jgi:hypothetical protein
MGVLAPPTIINNNQMELLNPQFEKKLIAPDLPPEVGEYIKVLVNRLESIQPRKDELSNKLLSEGLEIGRKKLTKQEIEELTNLNNEVVKIFELIRKSRDEKKIVEEKEDLESQYQASLDHLKKELGFSPEKEIETFDIQIGGKTKDELIQEMEEKNISIFSWAKQMINRLDFTTSQEIKNMKLVRLTVEDLGLDQSTTDEIYKRADELGLDLCPAEVGPQLRLQSPIEELTFIAMKQIGILPNIFSLSHDKDQLELSGQRARPDTLGVSNHRWVFSLRSRHE